MSDRAEADEFAPDYISAPGETISDLLEEQAMSQAELADRLGVSKKHLNQVVNGTASISADLALGLEKVFSVPTDFWLAREALFRANLAKQAESQELSAQTDWTENFPVRELKGRGLIARDAAGGHLVGELLEFFGIASPKQWDAPVVAYRKSKALESDHYALATWLRIGELEARKIPAAPFNAEKFRTVLERARRFTRLGMPEWQPQLIEACAEAGVALVITEHFKAAKVNGATRWLAPDKALIQLSLRYKWEDILWFTFFHEAGHVLMHRKKEIFVESDKRPKANANSEQLTDEEEADRFAARTLIPARFNARLAELKVGEIPDFAESIGVAPAIVVGRLHHDRLLPFNRGNQLRRRFTV